MPAPDAIANSASSPLGLVVGTLAVLALALPVVRGTSSRSHSRHLAEDGHALVRYARSLPQRANADARQRFTSTVAPDDVAIQRVDGIMLETDISLAGILRVLGDATHPFEKLGQFICDTWEITNGETLSNAQRDSIRKRMAVIDSATELAPPVTALRLASSLSTQLANLIDGKTLTPNDMIDALMRANAWLRAAAGGSTIDASAQGDAHDTSQDVVPIERRRVVDAIQPATGPARDSVFAAHRDGMPIVDEDRFLRPYRYDVGAWPPPSQTRTPGILMTQTGQTVVHGEDGFYRVHRHGMGDWRIHAAGDRLSEVPLSWDDSLHQWQAHEPLRLRGGGGGSSKHSTKTRSTASGAMLLEDSISDRDQVLTMIHDRSVRQAVDYALDATGDMRLRRTNREENRHLRDNSIVKTRQILESGFRHIDPAATLEEQQQIAAEVTLNYYRDHPGSEAFCHENAEILFGNMIDFGVPPERIRMITMSPSTRLGHVAVLYSESPVIFAFLRAATPYQASRMRLDGLPAPVFAELIFESRDTTVLLDPWSANKIVSFKNAATSHDILDLIAPNLQEAGIQQHRHYQVTLSRPKPTKDRSTTH